MSDDGDEYLFNGPEYVPGRDNGRLISQLTRIKALMIDGQWRTLPEIEALTNDPPASISAQLRHLRKPKHGSYILNRRHITNGLFEYQLLPPEEPDEEEGEEWKREGR